MTNDAPFSEIKAQCKAWREANQLQVCFAEIRWIRNDRTGEIEIRAYLGCAPNESTVILYPVQVWKSGYWNKTTVRREMAQAKRDLFSAMASEGYTRKHLTQPIDMKSLEHF